MNTNIKITGDDFLKQYNDLEKKQKTLQNQVIKKMTWLLDNSNDPYLNGFNKESLKDHPIKTLIFIIKRVEDNYVSKTKQLNIFN